MLSVAPVARLTMSPEMVGYVALAVWLPEQDTAQQPTIRQVKTANRHRRQHAQAQQNPTPNNRQTINSDEGEVV